MTSEFHRLGRGELELFETLRWSPPWDRQEQVGYRWLQLQDLLER